MDIPFYSNPDATHCFQACLRSVLKYFCPDKDYSWEELDKLSGKRVGKWTWPLYAIGQLNDAGFETEIMEDFDYLKFIEAPNKYLLDRFGAQAGNEQIVNSDISHEVEVSKRYSQLAGKPLNPTIEHIAQFLNKGFLPICCLNLPALYGKAGYLGHFVLPTIVKENSVLFHDPGIQTDLFPARRNSLVSTEIFKEACSNDRFLVGLRATSGIRVNLLKTNT